MKKVKVAYEMISIEDLYVNPENDRYINDSEDEISAMIDMFRVANGNPRVEMVNLAEDISENGLNPFEWPIVWYDEELKKYIVIEGNRRITCIKLMTQFKENEEILRSIPEVEKIYKLSYPEGAIECVVYEDLYEAQKVLAKIHQDINEGIGRKQWDAYAKQKANSKLGNGSKTYSIIRFLREYEGVSPELLECMAGSRWTSKLERVVSFRKFKEVYNIEFSSNFSMIHKDSVEQVYHMMEKLVMDLINLPATDNFRTKKDFDNYTDNLPAEFKTQVPDENSKNVTENNTTEKIGEESCQVKDSNEAESQEQKNVTNGQEDDIQDDVQEEKESEFDTPRKISNQHKSLRKALRLSKDYAEDMFVCLGEKGKEIIIELESINYIDYPNASAALCRSILEYVVKMWLLESKHPEQFKEGDLPGSYNSCINDLANRKVLNDKQHKMLRRCANKEYFIDFLNSCIHADSKICVQQTALIDGWKCIRILVELYVEGHQK